MNGGYRARREGYRVDNTPAIGSIAWSTAGTYGHVSLRIWKLSISSELRPAIAELIRVFRVTRSQIVSSYV